MILDTDLEQMFQDQMNRELFNAHTYFNLAGRLEAATWDGFAAWCRKAGNEELEHYRKFNDFLVDRNCVPSIGITDTPESASDPSSAVNCAYQLEMANTAAIMDLDAACESVGDAEACNWLIWALTEQREAEREIVDILTELNRANGDYSAMLLLDKKYGG